MSKDDGRSPILIPTRTQIEVLGPDDPNRPKLGFMCYEQEGAEVYLFDRAVHGDGLVRERLQTITARDGLTEGLEILVPSLFGGYHVMKVVIDEYGQPQAHNDTTGAILKFTEDDRKCWVSLGTINLKGIQKLEKRSDESV